MKRKIGYMLSTVLIVSFGVSLFIDSNYIYSPLSFDRISDFSQVSWSDFKQPVMVELEIKDKQIVEYLLQNEAEIKYIYDELTSAEEIEVFDYKGDRYVLLQFARGNLTDDTFDGFFTVEINKDGIAKISEDLYVQVSEDLMEHFKEVENRDTVLYLLNDMKASNKE